MIGVCSWSMRASSPTELAEKIRACGLSAVQLALDPIRRGEWNERETIDALRRHNLSIVSGMMAMRGEDYSTLESIARTGGVRLAEHWQENLAAAQTNAAIAQRMGIPLVTFHAGFLSESSHDPERQVMLDRLRQIADAFASCGVKVALETGQETAATLIDVLRDLNHEFIGVNFDPANMILYGKGEPVFALTQLLPWVKQIHIKDALPSVQSDQWGMEMPVGRGAVDWRAFISFVREQLPDIHMLIERESRVEESQRLDDIREADRLIRQLLEESPQ